MNWNLTAIASLIVSWLIVIPSNLASEWNELPLLPDREGFAGMFAGVSGELLIVAGGANFPDKKPWEGGKKQWYDTIYALKPTSRDWMKIGKLPRPLAYGVSGTYQNSVICIGGSDSNRHYSDAFRLTWQNETLTITDLPKLPVNLANAHGALVGEKIYITGGQTKPDDIPLNSTVYSLDLSNPKAMWEEHKAHPGKSRMLAVAAGCGDSFCVAGGTHLDSQGQREYLKDAYIYSPITGWKALPDMPAARVAAPSPAPSDNRSFTILGGDDGTQLTAKPGDHRGFTKTSWKYDLTLGKWIPGADLPFASVTTPCVHWNNCWVVPSGEMRPGIRTPRVWSLQPTKSKE